jgi:hypothetical protein
MAAAAAQDGINQSRARGRPKYEALGLITRAQALHRVGRTREAIADATHGVKTARRTEDPALILLGLDTVLGLDGDDRLSAEAVVLTDRILDALPDETMRRRFAESEVVRRVHKGYSR